MSRIDDAGYEILPPVNAMHFADVDANLIMANGVERRDGMTEKVHNSDLCEFYAGKQVTILSSQGPSNFVHSILNRYTNTKLIDLQRGDLFEVMENDYGITIEKVLSTDDYALKEAFREISDLGEDERTKKLNELDVEKIPNCEPGYIYHSLMRPLESEYHQVTKEFDTKPYSPELEAEDLRYSQALQKLRQNKGVECALNQETIIRTQNNLRTKGYALKNYLDGLNIPKATPICMTDDNPDYLDSILEKCKGRNLYLYLTDTTTEPSTIVRYDNDPKTDRPGPIGKPIAISDFARLEHKQRDYHLAYEELYTCAHVDFEGSEINPLKTNARILLDAVAKAHKSQSEGAETTTKLTNLLKAATQVVSAPGPLAVNNLQKSIEPLKTYQHSIKFRIVTGIALCLLGAACIAASAAAIACSTGILAPVAVPLIKFGVTQFAIGAGILGAATGITAFSACKKSWYNKSGLFKKAKDLEASAARTTHDSETEHLLSGAQAATKLGSSSKHSSPRRSFLSGRRGCDDPALRGSFSRKLT